MENAVQQQFIQKIIEDNKSVNVFLVNGIKLQGVIQDQDVLTLVVGGNKGNSSQLVYKHAISTIQITS